MLNLVQNDVRSSTGKNLRGILLQTSKTTVDQLLVEDSSHLEYFPLPQNEQWKVKVLIDILMVKNGEVEIQGFANAEFEENLNYLCAH